jgi:hypothetical protein
MPPSKAVQRPLGGFVFEAASALGIYLPRSLLDLVS